jgi:RNase adaptor protein for sRNA GlmZ degradation
MLKVSIRSFSFHKDSYPKDSGEHGGGFVFDCRALPNPGRYPEYKMLSGKDQAVKEFLEQEKEVDFFREAAFQLVSQSVKKYIERGFTQLQVNFGCTGGQHRSVYFAEKLGDYLKSNFKVDIELKHLQEKNWA